ncbi:hypothetical protein GCM10023187_31680 [Nibrella viscosa]|uniref:Peptidase C14 caspase domain-containing protein n=1 Tax=Nibrella viscosa TaxID=1084524 RepID=A0ABP8KK07_9BACT
MKTTIYVWIGMCILACQFSYAQQSPVSGIVIPIIKESPATIRAMSRNSVSGREFNRMFIELGMKEYQIEIGDTLIIKVNLKTTTESIGIIPKLCYDNCQIKQVSERNQQTNGYEIDTISTSTLTDNTLFLPINELVEYSNEFGNPVVLDNSTLSTIYIYFTNAYRYDVQFTYQVDLKKRSKTQAGAASLKRSIPSLKTARYHALLIGVDEYDDPRLKLRNPASDIARLDSVLALKYVFSSITRLVNPTKRELREILTQMAYTLVNDDNLLVYFAGHAIIDQQNGYWVLKDSKVGDLDSYLSVAALTKIISQMRVQHVLLVADACFGSAVIRSRDITDFDLKTWQERYNQRSRRAISSSYLETVPDKSTFSTLFRDALAGNSDDFVSAEALFDSFKHRVYNKSTTRQRPVYGNIDGVLKGTGDFVFRRRQPADSGVVVQRTTYALTSDPTARIRFDSALDSMQVIHMDQSDGDTTRAGIENYANRAVTLVNTYKGDVTVNVSLKDLPASQRIISIPPNKTKILDLGNFPAARVSVRTSDNHSVDYQLQRGMRYQILWLADSGQLDLYLVR